MQRIYQATLDDCRRLGIGVIWLGTDFKLVQIDYAGEMPPYEVDWSKGYGGLVSPEPEGMSPNPVTYSEFGPYEVEESDGYFKLTVKPKGSETIVKEWPNVTKYPFKSLPATDGIGSWAMPSQEHLCMAELLIDMESCLVSREIGVHLSSDYVGLVLKFRASPQATRMRALVEGWTVGDLVRELY